LRQAIAADAAPALAHAEERHAAFDVLAREVVVVVDELNLALGAEVPDRMVVVARPRPVQQEDDGNWLFRIRRQRELRLERRPVRRSEAHEDVAHARGRGRNLIRHAPTQEGREERGQQQDAERHSEIVAPICRTGPVSCRQFSCEGRR
jgi:hypothetical protein